MPKFEDHDCILVRLEEDIVTQFIDTGILIFLRRKFRSWCMISRKHPETSKYFKSNAACRNEQIRHLVQNYYMIHPFSMFNLYWEFYMFWVYTLLYISMAIDASNFPIKWFRITITVMHTADIIKLFFTGFYSTKINKVRLEFSVVSKRYLSTFFIFDIASGLRIYVLILRTITPFKWSYTTVLILRVTARARIVRVFRWLAILELFRLYMGYSSYLFKAISVVIIFLVITFWSFSFNFLIENYITKSQNTNGTLQFLLDSYYDATLKLLLVSYGKNDLNHILEYINAIIFLCFGFALQLFIYAQTLQVWTKFASAENKHYSLYKQFKEYMKYKELPIPLRERIFSYFQFKFHKQFFKESDINKMVSPLLKQEILLHVTRNHIERVDFFRHLPENILMKLVAQLRTEIFLPGDVIISAGTPGTSMFFIYHGTVAVYTPSGKEVCHLEDGAHFGEIALILCETRVATVVSVTASELFMLRRSDFLAAIEPFPKFRDKLITQATERLHKTILHSE